MHDMWVKSRDKLSCIEWKLQWVVQTQLRWYGYFWRKDDNYLVKKCSRLKTVERGCGQEYEWFAQKPSDAMDSSKWREMIRGNWSDSNGVRSAGRQSNWATANWATHFGQLGDNLGRVIKDVNVGKVFAIISFWYIIVVWSPSIVVLVYLQLLLALCKCGTSTLTLCV